MGKNKLRKFAEMAELPNVFQYPFAVIQNDECPLKGRWGREIFGNDNKNAAFVDHALNYTLA